MRTSIYTILMCSILLFASCEKSSVAVSQGQPIYLSVTLPTTSQTKVPFEGAAPTTSNPLNVDVWASTIEKVFADENKNGSATAGYVVSIHTGGHFQSGSPQLLSQAVYPPPRQGSSTAAPVYFVAMHPQSNTDKQWSTTDGKQSIFTFTGCEDVMFAPQVSGNYDTSQDQDLSNSPELAFKHLLTRFTVKMGVELGTGENVQDVIDAWGKIKDIKIQVHNSIGYEENLNIVIVDLTKGSSAYFNYDRDVSFTSSTQGSSMSFYSLGTDTPFPGANGYTLTQQIDSVAYVMCAPVVASATEGEYEYLISVKTEKRGVQKLELDLEKILASSSEKAGSTMGKHYLVTLKFKKGSSISLAAKVAEWKNGGFGTGEIED